MLEKIERSATMGGSSTAANVTLISQLTCVPENDVRRIDLVDSKKIETACEDFFTESGVWDSIANTMAMGIVSRMGSGGFAQAVNK
jgi:hypothetical protein